MVWSKDNPSTEAVAQVDDPGAADKPDNVRKGGPQCQDENLGIEKKKTGHRAKMYISATMLY